MPSPRGVWRGIEQGGVGGEDCLARYVPTSEVDFDSGCWVEADKGTVVMKHEMDTEEGRRMNEGVVRTSNALAGSKAEGLGTGREL